MLKYFPTMMFFSVLVWILILISFFYGISVFWSLIPLFIYSIIAGYTSFTISTQFYIPAVCTFNTSEKKIALTFDDGPHDNTEKILEVLKKYNVKATFFCIGKHVEKYPEIVKKIDQEGHLLGGHTYSHHTLFPFFPIKKIKKELLDSNDIFYKIIGKKPLMFRPPYGVTNPLVASGIKKAGLKVIAWSIRTLDTVKGDFESVKKNVDKQISPGGIILLHDSTAGIELVTEQLIVYVQSLGYSFVELDKVIDDQWYERT